MTGILTATADVERLRTALDAALTISASDLAEDRAEHARAMVRDQFTIQRMSAALGRVYGGVAREEAELFEPARRAG
ncbi:hypothetical protein GCM10025870_15460 [Agromyces marinus]|uniref:Uncharacterized protein n=1 Tax=Agromyces marinus TaxID=1389020 RepID=A0ABM8H144_9MICO|nr:hypothetical protein [Agromyces marinus]BDZ54473.1 hypothetical protein GCM10025870_15460 [Agromyces marinus]